MSTENAKSGDSRLDQVIAGEYVLGVLSPEDRQKVEARMVLDRNFAAMVDHWQSNLLTVDPVPKSPRRQAPRKASPFSEPFVAARPRPDRAGRGSSASLWNSAGFWRFVACVATVGLAVTGLSQSGVFTAAAVKPLSTRLGIEGANMALSADYDAATGRLRLAPVAASGASPLGETGALQLWLTDAGRPPVSLGVFARANAGEIVVPKADRFRLKSGSNLTLSVEPPGGSLTGTPTQPVLATGQAGQR